MHQGTANKEKIRLWGELWSRIVDYAATETNATVNTLPLTSEATESYYLLRDVICKGMTELQEYLDERAKEFGVIKIQTMESGKEIA